jgi:hypothetical protein
VEWLEWLYAAIKAEPRYSSLAFAIGAMLVCIASVRPGWIWPGVLGPFLAILGIAAGKWGWMMVCIAAIAVRFYGPERTWTRIACFSSIMGSLLMAGSTIVPGLGLGFTIERQAQAALQARRNKFEDLRSDLR